MLWGLVLESQIQEGNGKFKGVDCHRDKVDGGLCLLLGMEVHRNGFLCMWVYFETIFYVGSFKSFVTVYELGQKTSEELNS